MDLPNIRDVDLAGRRVIVRSDLSVPLDEGRIGDGSWIVAALVTFREVVDQGGRLIVISHLGRPKGHRDPRLSLRPVARRIGERMSGVSVTFASDCVGEAAKSAVEGLGDGSCVVLENLRFHGGERDNDPAFADQLAQLGDVYVNDAFSVSHRAHASIVGLPERLPAAAGRLMARELDSLERLLSEPNHPYNVVLGGAKPETKVAVIEMLLGRADRILLGGVMASVFLKARGENVGCSEIADEQVQTARRLLERADDSGTDVLLPSDVVLAAERCAEAQSRIGDIATIGPGDMILDIGPDTVRRYREALGDRGTVVWNGTLGVAELAPFRQGTEAIATFLAGHAADGRQTVVAGGGDTAAFLKARGLFDDFTYVSMAGGAFLTWLAGKPLPGVEALIKAARRAAG